MLNLSTPTVAKTQSNRSPFWLLIHFVSSLRLCLHYMRTRASRQAEGHVQPGERPVHLLMQINMINWEEAAFPHCQLLFKKGTVERIYTLLFNCASFPPAKGNNDTERRQTVHVQFLFLLAHTTLQRFANMGIWKSQTGKYQWNGVPSHMPTLKCAPLGISTVRCFHVL